MVDCSDCEWKKELNSMSCKKNDENLGWINCDYSCTPFQGQKFETNYLNKTLFVDNYFCNGPDNNDSCDTRNANLKTNYNTNKDICIFDSENNSCKIRDDVELSNLYTQTRIFGLENQEIYNNEILDNEKNLKYIKGSNIDLDNSPIESSNCKIENLLSENDCDGLDNTECDNKEGCIYDYNLENEEESTCVSRQLTLPSIEFSRYYNDLYAKLNENTKFSIIYNRYKRLKDINNWPCIEFNNDYPVNCSNNSNLEKMVIKEIYINQSGETININITNEKLLLDQNMLIELINDRCFSNRNESYCLGIEAEADLNNIEDYARIIRNNTISVFNELSAYTLDKVPYILALEFNLFLDNPDNRIGELLEQEVNVSDINNAQLYPDNLDFFIENLESNENLRNCFDDMLYTSPNDNELFDYILVNPLPTWEKPHFDFITRKIDRFIEIGPHSINGCLRMIENVNANICRGEVTTGIISVISLITEVVGIQIDLNNIKRDDPKLQKLMEIIFPRIPEIVKKITDLSSYYEQNNCDGKLNTNTKVLIEFYEQLLQPDLPTVNYNLFNTESVGSFFDDFINGNVYKKIILLIFIYLILSKIASILQKK